MAVKNNSSEPIVAASASRSGKGRQRLWILALGDVVMFLIFAVIGRNSHGEEAGLQAVGQVVWTALPFMLAWFIIAPFVGAFRRETFNDPKKMEVKTLQSWVAAWPLGLILHFVFKQEMPTVSTVISFGLVTLIVNSIFLSIWRLPFAFFYRKKER